MSRRNNSNNRIRLKSYRPLIISFCLNVDRSLFILEMNVKLFYSPIGKDGTPVRDLEKDNQRWHSMKGCIFS